MKRGPPGLVHPTGRLQEVVSVNDAPTKAKATGSPPISIRRPRRGETRIMRRPMTPGHLGIVVGIDGRIVVSLADDVPNRLVQDAADHILTRHCADLGDGMVAGSCSRRDGCGAASTFRSLILPFRKAER